MKASRIMTEPVRSCGPDTNLASVVQTMWEHDCGVVPVVNERGEAVGMVTDRDVCVALGTRDISASALTARHVMSQPVVGCAPEDDCFSVLQIMERERVRRVPVLGIGGVLLGIVSLDDIVKKAASAPAGDPLRSGVVEVLAALGGHRTPARPALAVKVAGASTTLG
jgi:CBS domain-containing protein